MKNTILTTEYSADSARDSTTSTSKNNPRTRRSQCRTKNAAKGDSKIMSTQEIARIIVKKQRVIEILKEDIRPSQ